MDTTETVPSTIKEEFQALFLATGSFKTALSIRDDLLLWPGLTGYEQFREWALEVSIGAATPDPETVDTWIKRIDNYALMEGKRAIIEAARTSRILSKRVAEGKLPADKSSQYMHANNAVGFIYDKLFNSGRTAPTTQSAFVNFGQVRIVTSRNKQLPAPVVEDQDMIDAEVTDSTTS